MRLTTQQNVRASFGLLLILPTLLCFLAIDTIWDLTKSAEQVSRTHKMLDLMLECQSDLTRIESSEREFVLTGNVALLTRFDELAKSTTDQINEIDKIAGAREKVDRIDAPLGLIRWNLDTAIAELKKAIVLRQTQGPEAAASLLNAGTRDPMENVRSLMTGLLNSEHQSLESRKKDQQRNFNFTVVLFAFVLLANFVFVYLIVRFIRRESLEHEREEQRIKQQNIELENRVAERTEQLKRSNEDLEQFAYMASHDLKEPLRMVGSFSELLHRRYSEKLDEDGQEYIRYVQDGVRRMNALIDDMLTFSRAGQQSTIDPEPISSEDALKGALENLSVRIDDSAATVTNDPLPIVQMDQVRLTQIFQNLVGNAIKYRSEAPPAIHVSTQESDGCTTFSVRDNGMGISEEHRDAVFKLFRRLHGHEYEGTGIGLATCKKMIERNGGKIWFESEIGKGTTFFFTVPRRKPAKTAEEKPSVRVAAQR